MSQPTGPPQVASDEVVAAYAQYPLHKTYRKLNDELIVKSKRGEVRIKGPGLDLSSHPEMEAAVDRFTNNAGKPATRWDSTSVEKKISAVKAAGLLDTTRLELLLWYVYDDASEALHGTFYGCVFHLGVFAPGSPDNKVDDNIKDRLIALFWLGSSVVFQINEWFLALSGQQEALDRARLMNDVVTERIRRGLKYEGSL